MNEQDKIYEIHRSRLLNIFQSLRDEGKYITKIAPRVNIKTGENSNQLWELKTGWWLLVRSLIETVCKHIINDAGVLYDRKAELYELYHLTSRILNLAPGEYSERIIKKTLGGLVVVVEGIGNLRNIFGDAHGKSSDSENPSVRHAELAVNIAGALSTFFISTWESQKQNS